MRSITDEKHELTVFDRQQRFCHLLVQKFSKLTHLYPLASLILELGFVRLGWTRIRPIDLSIGQDLLRRYGHRTLYEDYWLSMKATRGTLRSPKCHFSTDIASLDRDSCLLVLYSLLCELGCVNIYFLNYRYISLA